MPNVPSSTLVAVNNLAGNFPESPARQGLVIGPTEKGTPLSIIRDDSINTVISEFGGGPGSEEAGTGLNERNHGTIFQVKTASSVAGTVSSVTKTIGATEGAVVNDFGAVLAPGADFDGNVLFTAKQAGAELEIVSAAMAAAPVITGLHVKLTVAAATTGTQLAAQITGTPAALAIWGAAVTGAGTSVCCQSLSTYSETSGRIGIQALTSGLSYRMTIPGPGVATPTVALTGGNIVDVTTSTNADGEPTGTALQIQSLLVSLAVANPGKFKSTLAGSGTGLLGAMALTALPFGSTGAMTVSGSPFDEYEITVQIRTGGALGAADFRISLGKANGVPIYSSAIYAIPVSGVVTIPGTGLTLTFTGSFDARDEFSLKTTAPTSSLADVADAIDYFIPRPEQAGLITIAGEIAITDIPAWVAAMGVKADELEAAQKYCRVLLEVAPPAVGVSNATWASQITALTSSLSHPRLSLFGGELNMVSALPLPQNARFQNVNGNRSMFARALSLRSGIDVGDQTLSGALSGVLEGNQVDVAGSLAAARLSYAYLIPGVPGVQAEFLLFDSPTGDFTYGVYGRVLDEGMFYGALRQAKYLSTAQRRNRDGTIDAGAKRAIEQDLRQVLLDKMVKPGNVNDVQVVVDGSNTDNRLIITYYFQVLFYVKRIDGRAGIVQTLSGVQVL